MAEATEEQQPTVEAPPFPPQAMQVGPPEIQQAASAGVRLLASDELRVPLHDATQLQILRAVLAGIANGDLRICSKAEAEKLEAMAVKKGRGKAPRPKTPRRSGGKR